MNAEPRYFPDFVSRPGGYIGLAGEITFDSDRQCPVVHDGMTAGGLPLDCLPFRDVQQMLASDWPAMGPGWEWRAGSHRYLEVASDAVDGALITRLGVKLSPEPGDEGAIPVGAFGLENAPEKDQCEALRTAVLACSQRRVALDIGGMDIRVGKQLTSDDTYKYVAGNRKGHKRGYAIYLPSGTFMKLVGQGTIGNLNPDDLQYLFHGVDCDYVEIGDGVTLDAYHTRQGWGGCLHLMGCERLHLGRCTFLRDDIVRFGASVSRRSGVLTFTEPRFIDGWGTHCIGGKPGGFREVWGDVLYFENCRGGFNAETQDEDDLNNDGAGNPLWDTRIVGHVGRIESNGLNGDKDPTAPCAADAFFASEARDAAIRVDLVIGRDHWASRGNAGCVTLGGGQTNQAYASLDVGAIHAVSVQQVLRYDGTVSGGEKVHVGKITGTGIGVIVKGRSYAGNRQTPGRLGLLQIDEIDVEDCGRILDVRNTGKYPGQLIDRLEIDKVSVGDLRKEVGPIGDVGHLSMAPLQRKSR